MAQLELDVVDEATRTIEVGWLFNAGYAGRDSSAFQQHVDELAELGVPAPDTVPTLYPLSNLLARQDDRVQVPHARTSGEAEWALVVGGSPDDLLVAAACDHTDRELEKHGVAWSKQSAPDIVGNRAWRWDRVADEFDDFTLRAWVTHDHEDELISDGSPAELLSPGYWIDRLDEAGLLRPGTVLLSGTIPMIEGVDQFADGWRVELVDSAGRTSTAAYRVERLSEPWG
jgi:2-keto-4-pentenoate hydratase/2-oxohepta-3-ene-1,7-dioic acid hydratase in catechol pathway